MKLNRKELENRAAWEAAGFALPQFDIDAVTKQTKEHPKWIHMGAGNIFRAFTANVQQNILNAGKSDTGIIAAEGFDYEIIEKMYKPHDNLGVVVTLKADGSIDKTVVASIVESLALNPDSDAEWTRLKAVSYTHLCRRRSGRRFVHPPAVCGGCPSLRSRVKRL